MSFSFQLEIHGQELCSEKGKISNALAARRVVGVGVSVVQLPVQDGDARIHKVVQHIIINELIGRRITK
jgi:hypothetical protein